MNNDNFFLSDYKILFKNNAFFPNKNMTRNQILNSFIRYSIILILVFFLIKSNFNWYFFPLAIIIGSFILYLIDLYSKSKNKKQIDKCDPPNINNPFMNVLVTQDKNDIPSCKSSDSNIKNMSDTFYKFNLYQNSDDLFNKKHLDRQFYTMPATTIPNNQLDFSNWLYKIPDNCKHDNNNCLEYEDIRYH